MANEASENLQGRDNPTFVYRGFVSLTYMLERRGVPADDLEPYPGAAAHVAIVSEDTRSSFTPTARTLPREVTR